MNISQITECPECKVSFIGESMFDTFSSKAKDPNNKYWFGKSSKEIWDDIKENYSEPYVWDKKIAVEIGNDRIAYYLCPECGYKMHSFFVKYKKTNINYLRKK